MGEKLGKEAKDMVTGGAQIIESAGRGVMEGAKQAPGFLKRKAKEFLKECQEIHQYGQRTYGNGISASEEYESRHTKQSVTQGLNKEAAKQGLERRGIFLVKKKKK